MNTTFANSMRVKETTYFYWAWYDCACFGVAVRLCKGEDLDVTNVCLGNCYPSLEDALSDTMMKSRFEIVLKNMKGE